MMRSTTEHYPSLGAVWLGERIPLPLMFILVIGAPMVGWLFLGFVYELIRGAVYWNMLGGAFVGFAPLYGLYSLQMGQKLAWDEARVYMRPSGWALGWTPPWFKRLPWRSLAYEEIESLDAVVVNDPGARSFLLPFQLLRLNARGASEDFDPRHIWLYSLSLKDKDVAPLLRQLDAKCPGMLPDVVLERLAKWADNDR